MCVNNIIAEVMLMVRVFQPGTGYNEFFDSSTIRTDYEEIYSREIIARISLIIGKAENGDIEIVYSFLNGIRRRMSVDLEATTSVIYNTDNPWKSRRFSIENVENNALYNCYDTIDTFKPDDHDNNDGIPKPDGEGDHEDNIDLKHAEKVELYDHHNDIDIYESDDEVNHDDIDDTINEPKEVEQDEVFSTSSEFHPDFIRAIHEDEDKNVRNIQGTERLEIKQSHICLLYTSPSPRD